MKPLQIDVKTIHALRKICNLQTPNDEDRKALKKLAVVIATLPEHAEMVRLAVQYSSRRERAGHLSFGSLDQAQAWSNAIHDSCDDIAGYDEIKHILLPRAQIVLMSRDGFETVVDRSQRGYEDAGKRIGQWVRSRNQGDTRQRAANMLQTLVDSGETDFVYESTPEESRHKHEPPTIRLTVTTRD